MIELSKIRSIKVLEEMKKDMTEFLSNPEIIEVYREEFDEMEYECDKDAVAELLHKVEDRIKGLTVSLSKKKSRSGVKSENV